MLMERVLKVQLDAQVNMDFQPDGLFAKVSIPLQSERLVPPYE